jgi:nitrite reductase (NADH) small subunit
MNARTAPEMLTPEATPMNTWTPICRIHDIPVLGARRVARDEGMPVAIFRTADDEVYALLDRCPHRGGPLSQGIVHGAAVACPLHNMNVELATGTARAPDEGCTPTFACKVEAGRVYLDAGELQTKALDLQPPAAGPHAKACGHAC